MSLVRGKEYYLYGIKEHGFFYKLRYGDPEPHKTELFSIATNLGRPDNNFKKKSLLEIRQGDLIKVISSYSFGRQSKEFNDPTLLLGMLLEGFV